MNKYTINDITRASGGFAMLAVDQREAMRMMFAAAGAPAPVADSVLTDFKVNAAKALSPYASAILVISNSVTARWLSKTRLPKVAP